MPTANHLAWTCAHFIADEARAIRGFACLASIGGREGSQYDQKRACATDATTDRHVCRHLSRFHIPGPVRSKASQRAVRRSVQCKKRTNVRSVQHNFRGGRWGRDLESGSWNFPSTRRTNVLKARRSPIRMSMRMSIAGRGSPRARISRFERESAVGPKSGLVDVPKPVLASNSLQKNTYRNDE